VGDDQLGAKTVLRQLDRPMLQSPRRTARACGNFAPVATLDPMPGATPHAEIGIAPPSRTSTLRHCWLKPTLPQGQSGSSSLTRPHRRHVSPRTSCAPERILTAAEQRICRIRRVAYVADPPIFGGKGRFEQRAAKESRSLCRWTYSSRSNRDPRTSGLPLNCTSKLLKKPLCLRRKSLARAS
jgi:hypothetical protein